MHRDQKKQSIYLIISPVNNEKLQKKFLTTGPL